MGDENKTQKLLLASSVMLVGLVLVPKNPFELVGSVFGIYCLREILKPKIELLWKDRQYWKRKLWFRIKVWWTS